MNAMRKMLAAGALVCGLSPGVSHAEGWIVTVGARLSASPPYEGAGHDIFVPTPTFSLRHANSLYRFNPPDDGSSLALVHNRYIDFGPVARFRYARGNSGELAGLSRIGWSAEPGAFVNLWPTNWLRGRVEARRGVFGYGGWVGDAGADLIYTGPKWEASVGPRIGYGDVGYMGAYFGVTPTEAARSSLFTSVYRPAAGQRYTGAEAALAYHLVGGLKVVGDIGYHRLSKIPADSPIVRLAGSKDQYSGGIGLMYSFGVGH